jgi:hypothetical protein
MKGRSNAIAEEIKKKGEFLRREAPFKLKEERD